jgi:hypothetical protein
MKFLIVTMVGFLGSVSVSAFDTPEHIKIGQSGYIAACDSIRKIIEKDSVTSKDSGVSRRFSAACQQPGNRAELYGQSVSISGDFLSSPNKFFDDSLRLGLMEAPNGATRFGKQQPLPSGSAQPMAGLP